MQVKAGREARRKNDVASRNFRYKKNYTSAMLFRVMQ